PYTHAEPIEKQHLILLPKLASLSDLGPIKLDALEAETNGDFETAEQLWWRVIAVSPVDPQAHEAIGRIARKQLPLLPAEASGPDKRQPRLRARPIRLTRRQIVGIGALATAGAGVGVAFPFVRRLLSGPSLRTMSFDVASVDAKGARNPPERYSAL